MNKLVIYVMVVLISFPLVLLSENIDSNSIVQKDAINNASQKSLSPSDTSNYLQDALRADTVNEFDTLVVNLATDRDYLSRICGYDFRKRDEVRLNRHVSKDLNSKYRYEIICNDSVVWEMSLKIPTGDLDTMFVRENHAQHLRDSKEIVTKVQRGYYPLTPWQTIPPLFARDGVTHKFRKMLQWESGGEINFHRDHQYNFRKEAGDTSVVYVNLVRPVLYDHSLNMNYSHKVGIAWVGAGIERSWQLSRKFDTLWVDRGRWFSRMGWNLSVAIPGVRYKLYRDPRVVPFYGQYEDSLYSKLYPGARYGFLKGLNITKDSILKNVEKIKGVVVEDTVNRIEPVHGLAHEIDLKFGHFQYAVNIYPHAYYVPIHTISMNNMPFFRGDWSTKLIFLPNRRVIPHLGIDFYRTSIKIGNQNLGISPFHFELEVWDRLGFFTSLGFNAELKTKNNHSKE